MAKFFINRPIVAMVISILMVIIGLVAMSGLPIAQFPNIVPLEIQVKTTYTGADAVTVEQSVATPIEQQMSGVDNMNYMYSLNANNGQMTLYVNFDVKTDPNTDQILAQMRQGQAESQMPSDVRDYGVTVQKSTSAPLIMFALYSPNGTYDGIFLANYSYININDQMTRVPGIASVTIFGAGQYSMRFWVKPDQLAKLNITIPEIVNAIKTQNTVNPAGQIGAEPVPPGQEFTYAVRAQGRLQSEQEFGEIIIRAQPDGSFVRLKDVARIELGSQTYNLIGRLNGKPAALVALYQLPGSNAIEAAEGAKKLMERLKESFPPDLDYAIALDTTLAVTEGMKEIQKTLYEALALVIIVVFLFLQGWRATLIPLLAVPVSLVGTFALFPLFGFSINTLSLFGLVLAIGLVVDDAIVVVEAVEHHMFDRATGGYVSTCRLLIRRSLISLLLLAGITVFAGFLGKGIPMSFLPEEDQGYMYAGVQLPDAASLQRTDEVMRQAEEILSKTPGVKYYSSIVGYSMLSQLEITKKNAQSFEETLKIFTQRFEGGVASKLETASAEALVGTAAANIPEIERQIVLKENQINVLLGRNPGPVDRGAALLDQYSPPEIPAGLPSALMERRPDIRQAEQNLRAANAQVGVATANFFPQIGLTALLGQVSPELSSFTSGKSNLWSVGGSMAGPLFQGGTLVAQYRQAKAVWEEARLKYEQTTLNAFQEVSNALISRQKLAATRTQQLRTVKAYEEAVQVALKRYVSGKASYYEVLQNQQNLFPAETTLARTELEQLLTVVQLYKALGGGWQETETINMSKR
ncbi:efflux RND transporter permease subunit [Desulforhabdus sp. TSK]|uniref:efflux RND transporter permease subunit n=1 Tax=Desulforhabdus sp. TSK TaxID=2925014 RepID=UPI001FC8E006|nr:efflux RND transporter permease subunit [Desulforhabdus sp. TSK]GKT10309.1 hypothetical protein DSTSK_36140 [Desulforhabdus sp. TSK]